MSETNTELSGQEQYDALIEQLLQGVDPTDYMAPSIREIVKLDMDTLKTEYDLVLQKQSNRSSNQRRMIVERYEIKLQETNLEIVQETVPAVDVATKPVKAKKIKKIDDDQK